MASRPLSRRHLGAGCLRPVHDRPDGRPQVRRDVSKDTIAALAPSANKAQQDGQLLKQRIDAVIADLGVVQGPGASATPTQTPAPITSPVPAPAR